MVEPIDEPRIVPATDIRTVIRELSNTLARYRVRITINELVVTNGFDVRGHIA
jgi:hypothetical protein